MKQSSFSDGVSTLDIPKRSLYISSATLYLEGQYQISSRIKCHGRLTIGTFSTSSQSLLGLPRGSQRRPLEAMLSPVRRQVAVLRFLSQVSCRSSSPLRPPPELSGVPYRALEAGRLDCPECRWQPLWSGAMRKQRQLAGFATRDAEPHILHGFVSLKSHQF